MPGPKDQPAGSVGPFAGAGVEDAPSDQTLLSAGGEPIHALPAATAGELRRSEAAGVTDTAPAELVLPAGGGTLHGLPQVTTGQKALERQTSAVEDALFYSFQDGDYQDDKNDADGNELLNDLGLEEAKVIDVATGSGRFGAPTAGDGFYGADRNGDYRVDGELAQVPGSNTFGTLAAGRNRRSWRFNDDEPDADGQLVAGTPPAVILDGVLRLTATGMAGFAQGQSLQSGRRWHLLGDFDVQVDFASFAKTAGTDFELVMEAISDALPTGLNACRVLRVSRPGSENFRRDSIDNGVTANVNEPAGVGTAAGKLRLTRTGTTMEAFYDAGAGFVSLGTWSSVANIAAKPVRIDLHIAGTGPADGTVDAGPFAVNAGTPDTKVGWYREVTGAERGTLQKMPDSLGVITTQTSLELIDLDADKLWQGYNAAAANAIFNGAGERPHRVAWSEGVLAVAMRGGGGGGAVLIDFARDDIRVLQVLGSSVTGGIYRPGAFGPAGSIQQRNSGAGFSGDNNAYAIRSNEVNDVAIFSAGDQLYFAIGHQGGADVIREDDRFDDAQTVENALSSETSPMQSVEWSQAGQLFYVDDVGATPTIHEVLKVTIDAQFDGGTFPAANTRPFPNTISRLSQRRVHLRGAPVEVWICTDVAIYQSVWPGAFAAEFGKPGTGSANDILPFYDRVAAIALGKDSGGDDVLAASLQIGFNHQIVVLNLTSPGILGVTPVETDGRTATALGVSP